MTPQPICLPEFRSAARRIIFALVDDQCTAIDIVGTSQRHALCNARVVCYAVLSCNDVAQIAEMMLVVCTLRRAMRGIDRGEMPAAAFAGSALVNVQPVLARNQWSELNSNFRAV
jgi:hypothetical protein